LTYAELDERANEIAMQLQYLAVGPEARVAVYLDRSAALVAALLGVLKAGGVYVPLDPTYPAERLRFMLADSAPAVIVTSEALLERHELISRSDGLNARQVLLVDDERATTRLAKTQTARRRRTRRRGGL